MKKRPAKALTRPDGNDSCLSLLADIKERVSQAQVRAHLAVSRELILLYWSIGRDIVTRQKTQGWGKAVIEKLAADIQSEFPGLEGFSANNVWRMRAFYLACLEFQSLPQRVAEKAAQKLAQPAQELPPPELTMIPWYHNVLLVQRVKDPATRLWYARMTAEHGWSRNIFALQIDSD
jgi:predicted nuclease of restriction endonuclease-like (RecB) superfamily